MIEDRNEVSLFEDDALRRRRATGAVVAKGVAEVAMVFRIAERREAEADARSRGLRERPRKRVVDVARRLCLRLPEIDAISIHDTRHEPLGAEANLARSRELGRTAW